MIHSMTGFASRTFSFSGQSYKIEVKSLNHRFLEIKLRTPREWNSFEGMIRAMIEQKVKRGSVEVWAERIQDQGSVSESKINFEQAEIALQSLLELKNRLHLNDGISLRDVLSFPDVLSKFNSSHFTDDQNGDQIEVLKKTILESIAQALDDLVKMRDQEGKKLQEALFLIIKQFKLTHEKLRASREDLQKKTQEKLRKRIEKCFEAYPTPDSQVRGLMESRLAQEISIALEKTDIEEELTRFIGHVIEIEKLLDRGGIVGKKLDFMFQELNREINTLGSKTQDLDLSQEVIALKMGIEQMREQSLNLE